MNKAYPELDRDDNPDYDKDEDDKVVAPEVAPPEEEEPAVDYNVKFDMTAFAPEPKEEELPKDANVQLSFGYPTVASFSYAVTNQTKNDDVVEVELPITVTVFEDGKNTTYTVIRRLRFNKSKMHAEAIANAQHVTVVESMNPVKRMRMLAGLE